MIWLVCDHQETRKALTPLIAAKGYLVAEMDCGDEVGRRIRFQKPLLVIIDCGIAGSFELIATIRADSKAGSTPIVMFSIDSQNLEETALLKGADAYVPKGSLDWVELLVEVERFAGPAKGEDTSP